MSNNENIGENYSERESSTKISDEKKYFYERAIQGLEFHTTRFNTWMNFYALFVGAFFVAYYSLNSDKVFINLIIIVAGYFTSVCWYCSLSGYYSWLKGWTKIVMYYEDLILKTPDKKELRVYSLVDDTYLTNTGLSTQKITKVFIGIVIFSWLCVIGYEMPKIDKYYDLKLIPFIEFYAPIFLLAFTCLLYGIFKHWLLSDVSKHYKLSEDANGNYTVKPPIAAAPNTTTVASTTNE